MSRTQAMAVGVVLVAVLIGAGLGSTANPLPSATTPDTAHDLNPATTEPSTLTVYVSGWVAIPGVVRIASGSIVADAVAAAGGALEGSQLDSINLARPMADGDHIQIPGPGETVLTSGEGSDGLISLNRAEAKDLEALPGVGPVLAERIVAHREANGPFQTVEDLLGVPGIGEAKLASIRDLVTVP
ncbi:MAG: ComEA family DNA-binding protein [Acidimicrobiia bacterium]